MRTPIASFQLHPTPVPSAGGWDGRQRVGGCRILTSLISRNIVFRSWRVCDLRHAGDVIPAFQFAPRQLKMQEDQGAS